MVLSAGMSYLNMTVMAEWKHLQMPTGTRRRISMKVDFGNRMYLLLGNCETSSKSFEPDLQEVDVDNKSFKT